MLQEIPRIDISMLFAMHGSILTKPVNSIHLVSSKRTQPRKLFSKKSKNPVLTKVNDYFSCFCFVPVSLETVENRINLGSL